MTKVDLRLPGMYTMQFSEIEGEFVRLYCINGKTYEKDCCISEFINNGINPFEFTNEMLFFMAEETESNNRLYNLSDIMIFEERKQ